MTLAGAPAPGKYTEPGHTSHDNPTRTTGAPIETAVYDVVDGPPTFLWRWIVTDDVAAS
jgi:hypothetical protein